MSLDQASRSRLSRTPTHLPLRLRLLQLQQRLLRLRLAARQLLGLLEARSSSCPPLHSLISEAQRRRLMSHQLLLVLGQTAQRTASVSVAREAMQQMERLQAHGLTRSRLIMVRQSSEAVRPAAPLLPLHRQAPGVRIGLV